MLIFKKSRSGRRAVAQAPQATNLKQSIPAAMCRSASALLPEVSELQTVRHFTKLSRKNFSIDTQFYPLGSCTMKYNPRGVHALASLSGFLERHPLSQNEHSQGFLQCAYELQEILGEITGMDAVSLAPMAGAQGEFAGMAMIRAYHEARGDTARTEVIVPDAAHGTNPASAVMCGYKVREVPTLRNGDMDLEALSAMLGPQTAGIMLTNPSTLGVFERQIKEVSRRVHEAGGLLYYDGANLNAILGKVRPGDMGFDVIHMNLHKTFATPHGGGGPGSGPVGVGARLKPYLPIPCATKENNRYRWLTEKDCPETIGRLSAFGCNAGIIVRAYLYARLLGCEGLTRVSEFATLNANYLMKRLADEGFTLAYPERRASHEFIVTLAEESKTLGVNTMDFAKGLLDFDMHAPTTYFPLVVPECLLIEPTETETKAELDAFVDAMVAVREIARKDPDKLREGPYKQAARRLDDVRAARQLDIVYRADEG